MGEVGAARFQATEPLLAVGQRLRNERSTLRIFGPTWRRVLSLVGARDAEEVALHEVAAGSTEMFQLFCAAHSLGDDLHVERMGKQDKCPHQSNVGVGRTGWQRERTVELEIVGANVGQHRQRARARPEVVDSDANTDAS